MSDSGRPAEAELMARLGLGSSTPRVCDFCSGFDRQIPAAWVYPASAAVLDVDGIAVEIELGPMSDDWAACDTCSGFIDRDDYSGLACHMGHAPGVIPTTVEAFRRARIGPRQLL